MDQQDVDLHMKIKQFLSKDAQFRNSSFDPAPYIIQILKDKSADHQAMIQKQQQLIQQQNIARELVDQICGEHSQQFLKFLNIPALYAQNLEKLKSNVSVVKKKVKETKALLLNTQKDIQQIHFNCMFNKKVYKQLKKIELRLQQYQTAYLALKNNQYYLCALNLPYVEGLSLLESTLCSRSQTLRLRMTSKAIDQINNFLFFSPKVILPSSNLFVARIPAQKDQKNNNALSLIANWDQQEGFYKRYKLFKKAFCLDYLAKIWQFSDLDRKQGKLGLMYDIIKGIIRIGKISDISSSIQMYGPKQISNIFLLLKCFRIKQQTQTQQKLLNKNDHRWFIDQSNDNIEDNNFISATMDIIGVLFRKLIIIHKIYNDFQQKQFKLNSAIVYKYVLVELKKLIDLIYFPDTATNLTNLNPTNLNNPNLNIKGQNSLDQSNQQKINQKIKQKLTQQNYINYGKSGYLISQSLKIIEKNIIQIQEKQFGNCQGNNGGIGRLIQNKGVEMLVGYQEKFYNNFHVNIMNTLEEIFCKQGHSFIMQSFQTIISYKNFNKQQIKYMSSYKSDDRKSIREYVYLLSFMKALEEYFQTNKLNKQKLYKYIGMGLVFFYLKLNYHVFNNLISVSELLVIEEQKKTDKKLKKKQQEIKRVFDRVLITRQIKLQKISMNASLSTSIKKQINRTMSTNSNIGISFHTTDKLKVILRQNHMLLTFITQLCTFIEQQQKNGQNIEEFIKLIGNLQPANYDDQIRAKLIRVWDSLPDSGKFMKGVIAACVYKLVQLHFVIVAKIYRDTGTL